MSYDVSTRAPFYLPPPPVMHTIHVGYTSVGDIYTGSVPVLCCTLEKALHKAVTRIIYQVELILPQSNV